MVRGDLIVPTSDRIMTRSKARQSTHLSSNTLNRHLHRLSLTEFSLDPDRYTIIPVPVKIIKVLIEELLSAGGNFQLDASTAQAAALAAGETNGNGNGVDDDDDEDDDEDDGDWEDIPNNTLDLGLASTKEQLMSAFGDGTNSFMSSMTRQRDDETQAFLVEFFRDVSSRNVGRFQEIYNNLSEDEREKLQVVG